MAFCPNCGAQHTGAEKFCGECGYPTAKTAAPAYQQPAQQSIYQQPVQQQQVAFPQKRYAPAPQPLQQPAYQQPVQQPVYQPQAPVKKKSKKPLIIGGATGVVALGLAAVLIFTNCFGLLGKGGGGTPSSGNVPSIKIDVPKDASDEEKIAYWFIEKVVSVFEMGNEYAEDGLTTAAAFPYGTAAASICSMRYALDCLLEMKGVAPPEDGRPRDWDYIASLGWASPHPYVFEGVVFAAKGEQDAAISCYEKAAVNVFISEDDHFLIYIINLNTDQLQTLRLALTEVEDKIFDAYAPIPISIPRSENNWDAYYLREQGIKALDEPEPDAMLALLYYRAALSLEPFNGNNYAGLAALCIEIGEPAVGIGWLNEGLFIDPDNEVLNALLESMKGVLEP